MVKKLKVFGLIIAIVLVVGYFARNIIITRTLSTGIKVVTGLGLEVKKLNIGVFSTLLEIVDLKILNPSNFTDKVMVDVPEIYVNYNLGDLFKRKIHLEEVRFDLKEFSVVKNKAGELNLDSLKVVKDKKAEKAKPKSKPSKPIPNFQIDLFKLKIGKVVFKDYSVGDKPKIKEFNVNIDEEYRNITDPYSISSIILVKAFANTTLDRLVNFDVGLVADGVKGVLSGAGKAVTKTADVAKEAGKKTLETGKEVGEKVGDTLKKTGDTLKNILPFGGKEE